MAGIGAKMKFVTPSEGRPFCCSPVFFMVERRFG